PAELSTGSSIMPQKRNPDLFELTRARAAALVGDLSTVLSLKTGLAGGYHRDFQLLKAPLIRGIDRTREMLPMLAIALPRLVVDKNAARRALRNEVFATDLVMARVRDGEPFRRAYRDVAAMVKRGEQVPVPTADEILAARTSTGGLGNLPITQLRTRVRAAQRWNKAARRRFEAAITRLISGRGR